MTEVMRRLFPKLLITIVINLLPDYVARQQHSFLFCNLNLVESHKIANNSATMQVPEKNKDRFEIPGVF
jgi:hypothetical protein